MITKPPYSNNLGRHFPNAGRCVIWRQIMKNSFNQTKGFLKVDKKLLVALITAAMLVLSILTGCGPKPRIDDPPGPPPPPPPPAPEKLVPITAEIISAVYEQGLSLDKLGYYISVPLVLIDNNQTVKGSIDDKGKLTINEQNVSKELSITTTERGQFGGFNQEKDSFDISYGSKNVMLTFERNPEKNIFQLVSAASLDKNYKLLPNDGDPAPQLCIYFDHAITQNDTFRVSSSDAEKVALLDKMREDAENENAILLDRLAAARNENDRLSGELTLLRAEKVKLESDVTAANVKYETLDREFDENKSTVTDLEKDLAVAQNDNSRLNEQLSLERNEKTRLAGELAAANTKNDLLNREFDNEKTLNNELHIKLAAETSKTARLEGDVLSLNRQNDRLNGELNIANSKISELERSVLNAPQRHPVERSNIKSIEGRGSLDKAEIVAYIRSKNPAVSRSDVEALIDTYIREAQRENINHDIAIAQMCHATDYMRNQQFLNFHNYAGFAAINRTAVRYANMTEGVRAHIQHLKGYSSYERPQGTIVDKRYQILVDNRIQGTVRTLDGLFEKWAPDNPISYGQGINSILDDLYR